jgi:putative hemolysin
MILINLVIIAVLIAINAFFVAVEYAAVASRRSRLDLVVEKDNKASRIVHEWLENPAARDKVIAANQVAITLVNLAVGAVSENTFSAIFLPLFQQIFVPDGWQIIRQVLNGLPVVLGLIIATGLQVIFGELVPKVAVLRSPETFALRAAPLMQGFIKVFYVFISLLEWIARGVLGLIGISARETHVSSMTLEEMKVLLSGPELEGVIEKPEREMLSAVIDFSELVVRQVSIPRTEIVGVEANAALEDILQVISESHVTKLPVYEDNLDQVIGILHVRDLIDVLKAPGNSDITARKLMREPLFVPETIPVNELLRQFRSRKQHLAIVMDEFGGTSGLVTLEDLVEEIVGDYRDSFESAPPPFQPAPGGSTLVDGLTLIDEINEHLHLGLFDPNYDTIAGYLLGRMGRIPRVGDYIDEPDHGVRLSVDSMDRLRITRVLVSPLGKNERGQTDG